MDRRKTLVWDLAEFARRLVLVALVSGCVLGLHGTSTVASTSEQKQTARVVSVRKVLRTPYIVNRYPQIHYYVLYFALRVSDQTYCGEYETPVLDEIDDLLTCNGRDVDVVLHGKRITVFTPRGRKLKGRMVEATKC
jgi:hypothetical protein